MRPWVRAILATLLVAVLPVATVWALWALGVVTSLWILAPLAVALALLASIAGAAYWKRRPAAGDVLFSDLLLWGWLRRQRAEHQLADAVELLSRAGGNGSADKVRLLKRLATALDSKDPYLDGHSHRVARFSGSMARRLHIPRDEAERIRTAAAIHDVGKLHVPPELLDKPARLTPSEAEVVHRHADEGAAMVACLGDPALSDIVRHHHERFDGAGYPAGLRGEAIPLGARIVAVADTFDAITSARPYRPAGAHKEALEVLVAEAGTQLDPVVVRAFVAEYARRRGLALWALLMLPVTKARKRPLPVGAVVGGAIVLGAAATAVQLTGETGGGDRARAAQVSPRAIPAPASSAGRGGSRRSAQAGSAPAGRGHAKHAARTRSKTAPKTRRVTPGSIAPRRPGTSAAPHRPGTSGAAPGTNAAPHRPAARSHPSPPARPPSRPRHVSTPRRPAPAPTATPPPRRAPPVSTPRPAPTPAAPTPQPTPSPQPVITTAEQCKKGGYQAGGYRNQGQCVSSHHGP